MVEWTGQSIVWAPTLVWANKLGRKDSATIFIELEPGLEITKTAIRSPVAE